MKISTLSVILIAVLMTVCVARGANAPLPSAIPPGPAAIGHGSAQCPRQDCCDKCGKPCCVPAPAKKKIEKITYGAKCVEFCIPTCPGLRIFHEKDCNGCERPLSPNCGSVRTKTVLIKKVQTKECDTCQCVPPGNLPH